MEIKEIQQTDVFYQRARDLRHTLFFKKHDLPFSILDDEKEVCSAHVVIVEGDTLIGYGRLTRLDNTTYQISQMVIDPRHQSQGYGTMLLKALIERAVASSAQKITLNARTTATRLYAKQGFVSEGETFPSNTTGVEHVTMAYIP
ncbi:GNAT family N-acetyltransferase [Pseudodesulfovibrio sediminis]|uniref:N-acetyltransferase domain-containing protein n=1 Tax=Pseudodesulfovibrio sediminis TaxID=2810563 RepID=A0ABM7P5L1_9BACT|nr:GNAT family N-acetyltransferase [Pseudodesulfovibrio sediminis]BCS88090.1 hypothetical protein PSDVSF_13320 [Pseudodesulfovibrio sediminis]